MITCLRRLWFALLAGVLVVCGVCGGRGLAADPPQRSTKDAGTARLLDLLEERQMPDVVLWVLDRVEKDPDAAPDLKKEVPFRRAAALVATSRSESNATRRAEVYDRAGSEIDTFLKESPEGERAIQAYLQKGNLLIERGRAKVEESKRPGQDAANLRKEAIRFFDLAIKALEGPVRKDNAPIESVANAEDAVLKLLREVDASLKELRGEGSGDKDAADKAEKEAGKEGGKAAVKPKKPVRKPGAARLMGELEERQDELRALLLKTRLLIAGAYYEKSRAFEPKSKEWEAALTESAKQYKELSIKYRTRGAGLFARYYEGRNYVVLGKRKDALVALADIRALEGEGVVPSLRAKAINSSLECWLEDKKYDEFDDRLQKLAMAPLAADRIDQDWLGMKYRAALLLERRAAALPDKEKAKRVPLLRDAQRLAMEVAKVNKDFGSESKALLAELGKQVPDDFDGGAKTFEAAMDSARAGLAAMQSRQAQLKQAETAKNAAAIDPAKKEVAVERAKTIASLRRAMPLAGPDDLEALNQARYLLTYLLYEDQRLHEAAALGDFLVERYPNAKGSQQAARIAMASWQLLQRQPVAAWADEAKENCVETAEVIMKTWPDRPEAADAAVIAIAAATEAREPERIVEIMAKVPAASPRRAEVLLRAGGALWREVQEKSRLDEAARPPAAKLAGWRTQAEKAIDDGLAGMAAGNGPAVVTVAAALARAQMAMEDGDNARVAALLEHPGYGPWTVLNGSDQAYTQGPLATATATAGLRYFIETDQSGKAVQAMKKLEELASAAGAEASARLTAMYQSMGRDLQSQLMSLASGPTAGTPQAQARAAAILTGFEKFLEGVAKDPKLSSQMWAATTYLNLGSGEGTGSAVPKAKAEGYLDRAAAIYEGLLAKGGDEIAKFEPSIRLKMANVYREREKWDEAQKHIDWILSDKKRQNTLDFQTQAAELLQQAGFKTTDKAKQAEYFGKAISGYKRRGNAGEIWGWGWAVISNRLEQQAFAGSDEKAMEARRKFFQARLNAVKCRMEKAESLPQEREKELQKAFDYIEITFKMHPELGGPDTSKAFDKLLKEIEKRQNKPSRGVDGLKQAAEAAAG
jgi:cellulose synthase operon protein C